MKPSAKFTSVNRSIFKTYDIRGRYPRELNKESAALIGRRITEKLFPKGAIIVAHDARVSSPWLYNALVSGFVIAGAGKRLIRVGFASTPMLYFLVNHLRAAGGVMVTASHNPKEWNGFKVVGKGANIISGHELYRRLR